MIISRTPFRISFFGGGTDFPAFYRKHGGATLLTTIDKYCYLSVHELSPFFKHRFRASYAVTENVLDPKEFKHPLIRECLLHLGITRGMEIAHVADLPGRTGLGSSSSFTVGLLHALHAFRGEQPTPQMLTDEAIHIERERVGDPGGHQDQYAAAYGGLVRLDFSDAPHARITPLDVSPERLGALEERLLLLYTGIEKSAETILHEQSRRVENNTPALKDMLALVDEAQAVLTGSNDLAAFGDLLHTTWELKRSLSTGISNGALDEAYAAARRAGARGGKLLGAGGRGFLLLYAEPDAHQTICQAVTGMQAVPFSINSEGSRIIFSAP